MAPKSKNGNSQRPPIDNDSSSNSDSSSIDSSSNKTSTINSTSLLSLDSVQLQSDSHQNTLFRMVLVQWDMQLGPSPIVQFPPKEEFPEKEILLKLWFLHENSPEQNFVWSNNDDRVYCSLIREDQSATYLIILELANKKDVQFFQEILENIAADLISNLHSPHFSYLLSDTYKTIKNYVGVNEQEIYFRIFDDKIRRDIWKILKEGVISKSLLAEKLHKKYGYSNINLDLLLSPFIRLGLVNFESLPGARQTIVIRYDVIPCRVPPSRDDFPLHIKKKIINLFTNENWRILNEHSLSEIIKIFRRHDLIQFFNILENSQNYGISLVFANTLLNHDDFLISLLQKYDFIFIDNNMVYLLSTIHFLKFIPEYIIPLLYRRYKKQEISRDQLYVQLKYLITTI